jgi:hypothetical protein
MPSKRVMQVAKPQPGMFIYKNRGLATKIQNHFKSPPKIMKLGPDLN